MKLGGILFYKKTLRDIPLENSTVLLRVDYNVPLDAKGQIHDDYRIRASLPTIQYLLDHGCKVVVISHLGRPEGRDPKLSLEVCAQRLAYLLAKDVRFVSETVGDKVYQAVKQTPMKSVIVLENLRFSPLEEKNDDSYAKEIAKSSSAKYFIQDGFGVVHRAHTSTSAITNYLPSVAGLLLEKEYQALMGVVENPKRPLVAIFGGAKVSDKIAVIERFVGIADKILIGGAMANTFLSYKGKNMGASKLESDQNKVLDKIYATAKAKVGDDKVDDFIILPRDVVVAKQISENSTYRTVKVDDLHYDDIALDLGQKSVDKINEVLADSKSVLWNGTLGYAELPQFAVASNKLADKITSLGLVSIIGGGDTADFVLNWDKAGAERFTHISTGGGASIELLSGLKLPGIESLLDARPKKS